MLEVIDLYKKYPEETLGAVNGISFEMKKGEVVSLVGHSGSGKTTLLRMIAGLIQVDAGTIKYEGELLLDPVEQLIPGHDKIKLVHQDYQLKPNMTVWENIKYQLLLYDKVFQEERALELLNICKLFEFKEKNPDELSGGQQQRLAIARDLSEDPEILLLDEPFSNLDPVTKEDILLDLLEIVKVENIGVLLVTHDTTDALKVSNRVGYISAGQLQQLDTPQSIYQHPQSLSIGQFFGRINGIALGEETLFVRAENLNAYEGLDHEIEVQVIASTFIGKEYLIQGDYNKEVVWFYAKNEYLNGEKVPLGFNEADILSFY
jgi:ABC-type Fe3+/spermidine/putrescine transport system ATPase subunit